MPGMQTWIHLLDPSILIRVGGFPNHQAGSRCDEALSLVGSWHLFLLVSISFLSPILD